MEKLTLGIESLDWALRFLTKNGDNSLFRRPFELDVIQDHWAELRSVYAAIDVGTHSWSPARRFLYPKDRMSFRRASQLDPIDSILLSALVRELGPAIEARRLPAEEKTVFSFRFDPGAEDELFEQQDGWDDFWRASKRLAASAAHVVKTDVSEFYNQVGHDVVREQLEECEVPDAYKNAVLSLLARFSYGTRKGLPIGPHAVHLLAELSLVPFDNLFAARGYRFVRYIDDVHVFCPDSVDPHLALFDAADLLDRELGLSLNRGKTEVFSRDSFIRLTELKLQEVSTSDKEARLLEKVNEVTTSPYEFVSLDEDELERGALSRETVEAIFEECFAAEYRDYPHLGWILRRLAQVGAPGGVEYVIAHLRDFAPVIGDAAAYLAAASKNYDASSWPELGAELIDRLELPIVGRSDYVQMILVGLFSKITGLNHLDSLTKRFWSVRSPVKREIVLAAGAGGRKDWLYSLREQVGDFDSWLKRAFAYAAKELTASKKRKCLEILSASSNEHERAMIEIIMASSTTRRRPQATGMAPAPEKPTVFVSYSSKDSQVADKITEALGSRGVEVMIDRRHVQAGEDIRAFIKRAIASTRYTVFIVSRDSLLSSWVGLETVSALSHEDVRENRRLIACWIDGDFFERDFVLKSVDKIDAELSEIDRLAEKYQEKKLDSVDLDSERSRLFLLRNNLTKIVRRLRDSLTLDVREEKLDESVARMASKISGETPSL